MRLIPILWAASIRHLLRHPAQLALAVVGLSIGVATIVAVDIATASSARAFELSMRAVNGDATHSITGGANGIDERWYVELRAGRSGGRGLDTRATALTPIVEGYASIGERTLQLVGIDPLSSEASPTALADMQAGRATADTAALSRLARWLTERGAVVMGASTAAELGLRVDARFSLDAGGQRRSALLLGTVDRQQVGFDALVLTDIAQAQEWLGLQGRLSRIDVRVAPGAAGDAAIERLRRALPSGLEIETTRARTRDSLAMTSAFDTNLRAMSLLALMVGTLLIYGAMSFAVVQRRRIIGVLRALGATRADVFRILLGEAFVLGTVGAALGLALGSFMARALVRLVSRTINDLYFVVAVNQTVLPGMTIAKALAAGLGAALVGALLPTLEVAAGAPQLGLRRSVLEGRARFATTSLAIAALALGGLSAAVTLLSGRSVIGGFAALFLLLAGVAALTPGVLRVLSSWGAQAMRGSPLMRLALAEVGGSLSRTGVAVAALGMAVAAMLGVSIMVGSFRESLREWLEHSMRADVYIAAAGGSAGRAERRIDPGLVTALVTAPDVRDYSLNRRTAVDLPGGSVPLDALQLARLDNTVGMPLAEGDPAATWPAFRAGDIVVSEPLSWRLRLHAGQSLSLATPSGRRTFRIAGVFRDYGSERGSVMMDMHTYRRYWSDPAVTGIGIYLADRARGAAAVQELRMRAAGRQPLLVRSNIELRELSMQIFDRTFLITRVLYWLAAGVAAVGLVSSLLAWELERAHELAVLRSLGLTPWAGTALIGGQTVFMGVVALIAAVPAGLATAWLLIEVINRRAFGWQIDLHLSPGQFLNALVLSVAAAAVAAVYPAWRTAHAPIAMDIREE